MQRNRKKRRFDYRSTRHWHRYLGLLVAAFAFVLSITGIMLNHTEALLLDSRHIKHALLLRLYGIEFPDERVSFQAGDHWVSQIADHIYFDHTHLTSSESPICGAVDVGDFVAVATADSVVLTTHDGEVVEILGPAAGVPSGLMRVGKSSGGALVVAAANGGAFIADVDIIAWSPYAGSDVAWATSNAPPAILVEQIRDQYLGQGLPLERVILDIHSGRILGKWGVIFFDLIAGVLIVLGFSGIYIYFFPAGRRKPKRLQTETSKVE